MAAEDRADEADDRERFFAWLFRVCWPLRPAVSDGPLDSTASVG
jgi:hypothetical protein